MKDMATHSDFTVVDFYAHFGDKVGDLPGAGKTYLFVGDYAERSFSIDGTPTGTGYLIGQFCDVQSFAHRIIINDQDLGGADIAPTQVADRWQIWMDTIQDGVLKKGDNTIQIRRASGGDNFLVARL